MKKLGKQAAGLGRKPRVAAIYLGIFLACTAMMAGCGNQAQEEQTQAQTETESGAQFPHRREYGSGRSAAAPPGRDV